MCIHRPRPFTLFRLENVNDNERPSLPYRVLHWLRQGYPTGVPRHDTFALFYVLERELTEKDLSDLAELIIAEGDSTTLSHKPITRKNIGALIEHVHNQPPASASIAQVHRARLIGGKEVVLKIMRPGIDVTIEEDIHILRQLAGLMEAYFPQYQAVN